MTLVSVVIPSYNSANTIEKCIKSIAESTYKNIEIIVVDDCSTDNSPVLVENLQLKCPIKLVKQNENKGPATARNKGAMVAKGEYIFFFDSDTTVFPDSIDSALKELERLNADAITGIYHYEPLNKGAVPEYKAIFNNYFFSFKGIIPYEVFDSSRACIKKKVFDDLGGFNELLKWGMDYENEEFGYRLIKKYTNFLVPSFYVKHHFPDFKKLTKTYFNRVAYWAKIFVRRKKFESGGITSGNMGFGTASIFPAILFSPLFFYDYLLLIPLSFFFIYLKTFFKFFLHCLSKKGVLKGIVMIGLNIYFSFVISVGFLFGLLQFIFRMNSEELIFKN